VRSSRGAISKEKSTLPGAQVPVGLRNGFVGMVGLRVRGSRYSLG
jgi:hypothetical protein